MARHTLVVGRRLERDDLVRLRVGGVDVHAAGTRAVRRARIVVGARRALGTELLHGDDDQLRLRQPAEELRQLRVHLLFVLLVGVDDVVTRLRAKVGVLLDGGVERLQITEALLLRDLQHLRLEARHLAQADVVDLVGREARGRAALRCRRVSPRALGERPDADLRPSLRRVLLFHERAELAVGRENGRVDGVEVVGADAGAIGFRNGVGELRRRLEPRRLVGRGIRQLVDLRPHLLQEELGRHEVIVHAPAHVRDGAIDLLRERPHALREVVVVLDRGEREVAGKLRRLQMDAAHLVQRHLPALHPRVVDVVTQVFLEQDFVDALLL